jgi:hypothetical protein
MLVAIFWLVVLGLLAFFIRRCPIDEPFKTGIIILLIVIALGIVVSAVFGVHVLGAFPNR